MYRLDNLYYHHIISSNPFVRTCASCLKNPYFHDLITPNQVMRASKLAFHNVPATSPLLICSYVPPRTSAITSITLETSLFAKKRFHVPDGRDMP